MPESREPSGRARGNRQALLQAALTCTERWRWPVVPGAVSVERPGEACPAAVHCSCGAEQCPVPAAHPHEVPLLAATTEARMVRWWWQRHSPQAPVLVATGRRVAAVSLPAAAGARLLGYLDAVRVVPGPVLAGPTRWSLLVAPYGYPELAELLAEQERGLLPGGGAGQVPSSVRYHGPGGYLVLPPSRVGLGAGAAGVRWVRRPVVLPSGGVRLPAVGTLLEALVAAGSAVPDGSRLAY
ncbi:DNA primase [Streptomyces tateyamensis]|uniref:DNA primase n=1 Tax=Streptomyces tateyamensis TaxID=565073 RepID=A0A2V4N7Q7_9ACTN|nr:bifunctional DNA primase/polymerase [Streptomyces tateyamensis]PYC80476.1 DNA primase [Streptomyces tateyamensis]